MKAVRGQILPTKYRKIIHSALRDQILLTKYTKNTIHSMVGGHILPTRNAQKTVLSASEARFPVQKYANKLRPASTCTKIVSKAQFSLLKNTNTSHSIVWGYGTSGNSAVRGDIVLMSLQLLDNNYYGIICSTCMNSDSFTWRLW